MHETGLRYVDCGLLLLFSLSFDPLKLLVNAHQLFSGFFFTSSMVHVAAKAKMTRVLERLKTPLVTATVPRSGGKA